MSLEIQFLIAAVLLGFFQILFATALATRIRGVQWNLSSRDKAVPELTGMAGRVERAAENFKETFPFFVAAVVVAKLAGGGNSVSAFGAGLYFFARLAYLPIYALGVTGIRTAVWAAATLGILLTLLGPLWG